MNLTDDEFRKIILENLIEGCSEWLARSHVQKYLESVAGRYMGQTSARADLEIVARYAFGAGAAWGADKVAGAVRADQHSTVERSTVQQSAAEPITIEEEY